MQIIQPVDQQLWWEVARACPYATFFHTPRWTELACRVNHTVRDRTIAAILPNGVRAVLPLLEIRRRGPITALMSTFEGCYGGIIADGPLSSRDAARIYRQAYRWNISNFYYLANPLAPPETIDTSYRFGDEIAHILHLNDDFETIFNRFDKSARTNYRRGLREGCASGAQHRLMITLLITALTATRCGVGVKMTITAIRGNSLRISLPSSSNTRQR